jgi:hypothetical protein
MSEEGKLKVEDIVWFATVLKKRDYVEDVVKDLVAGFLYYDRKEDNELPRGEIANMIKEKLITIDQIVSVFREELEKSIK